MTRIEARERLIVALDVDSPEEALAIIDKLDGLVSFFKVGLQLQLSAGVEKLVPALKARHCRIFLDYKYFDVPRTIEPVVAAAAKLGVTFLTVHGIGAIMRAAVKGKGDSEMKILAVTVLTSLDADDLKEQGYPVSPEELVLLRTRNAIAAGCDGVIASGMEANAIRRLEAETLGTRPGERFLIVTPGIRGSDAESDDQKRIATPSEAILAGADYLVVGRPIIRSADIRAAAEKMLSEMQVAFDSRTGE